MEKEIQMISIIVPVYGVERFLSKCIESLMNQTYKDIEIILVEDGSPDGCAEICDSYAKKDKRIIVVHQVNQGVSAARNSGLEFAKGEYIAFVDPDDWVSKDMYKNMLETLQQENADMAICGYDYYDEDGNVDESRRYLIKELEVLTQKTVLDRFGDMPPSIRHGVCNKLFRTNLLQGQRFIKGLHSSEDVYFLTEYVLKIKKAVMIHQPFYKNIVRQGSATHGGLNIVSLADSFKAHDYMYQSIIRLYPELKDHALAFLMDVCTLKYNEAKRKFDGLSEIERKNLQQYLKKMRKYIKTKAVRALIDPEIYWKTRIAYLLI